MSESARIISLDVGGMSIRSAVVRDQSVGPVRRVPIDNTASADRLLGQLATSISVHEPQPTEHIAVAVPDPFDHVSGVSQMEHKFAALRGLPLRSELGRRLGRADLDIRFVNDAAAAGAGEAAGLAGRTLILTLGTGLGAALIDEDTLVPVVGDTVVGDLWTSAWTVDGTMSTVDDRFSARGLATALGVSPAELPDTIDRRASTDALSRWAADLGAFIDDTAGQLAAERVIIGGGAAAGFDHFARFLVGPTMPAVHQARLGSNAALLGAASLAFGS